MKHLDFPGGSSMKYYVQARTAHLERLLQIDKDSTKLYYSSRSYDWDPTLAESVGAVRLTPFQVAWRIWKSPPDVIEVNEPLMLSALPSTGVVLVAIQLVRAFKRKRVLVGTYAIENGAPETAVSLKFRIPKWAARTLISICLHAIFRRFDRIAFGTFGAQDTYRSWVGVNALESISSREFTAVEPECSGCSPRLLNKEPDSLLFVGSLSTRKGIECVIAAWEQAVSQNPMGRFVILGKGPLEDVVGDWASRQPSVTFLASPSRETIHAELSRASCVILWSQPWKGWREQIGLPILEGLSHGCTVVTTSQTGIADWLVRHGHFVGRPDLESKDLAELILTGLRNHLIPVEVVGSLPQKSPRAEAEEWLFSR